jgi:chromosome segregation ATPase
MFFFVLIGDGLMSNSEKIMKRIETALESLIHGSSVKGLKKRGIKDVHVITRKEFMSVVSKLAAESIEADHKPQKSSIQKRVELLLIEIERLRRDKSEIEHQKGLLETERAEMSGHLTEITSAGSKAFGEKISVDDIRDMLLEREQLRVDLGALKTQSDLAREKYEDDITNLRVMQGELESAGGKVREERDFAIQDNQRLKGELEASRTLAVNHKRKILGCEQQLTSLQERVENLKVELEQRTRTVAERDQTIDSLKNPPEPVEGEEVEGASELRRGAQESAQRPATRRMRGRTGSRGSRESDAYGFSFSSGQQRTSGRSKNRRRRLS